MNTTGVILLSDPPQYPHKCTECDHAINLDQVYPRIEHELTGEELKLNE